MQRIQQHHRDDRSEKGAEVVAETFKAERLAAVGIGDRRRDERIARRRADPRTHPIGESRGEERLPGGGESHERLGNRRQQVAHQRNRLAALQLVRQRAGESLDDVLRGLREAVHQADDAAAGLEHLGQEDRQDRIEHLGRDVGEEAGAGQQHGVLRQPGEVAAG